MGRWMDRWMDRSTDGQTCRQTDGWIDGQGHIGTLEKLRFYFIFPKTSPLHNTGPAGSLYVFSHLSANLNGIRHRTAPGVNL